MEGAVVSSEGLIKALKRNHIPYATPLIVEIPANTSMEVERKLAGRLATAGYKPVFKAPRHVSTSVSSPGQSSLRRAVPVAPGPGSTPQ